MSLVSRYLETNGLPTVVIGCARDIVEECGVARFVFTDFPLGNPCGKPWDVEMQRSIVGSALNSLERAWMPRTTVQTSFSWGNETWRKAFMQVNEDNSAALIRAGEERRQVQAQRKARPLFIRVLINRLSRFNTRSFYYGYVSSVENSKLNVDIGTYC